MTETLRQKQSRFVRMKAMLIMQATILGYELTDGHAERCNDCPVGREKSCHKIRLAQDFNLFKDGVYLSSTESHRPLGEYWESIGGSWGGRFNDGNHYSLEHNGRR
jgi:hypothetical protein